MQADPSNSYEGVLGVARDYGKWRPDSTRNSIQIDVYFSSLYFLHSYVPDHGMTPPKSTTRIARSSSTLSSWTSTIGPCVVVLSVVGSESIYVAVRLPVSWAVGSSVCRASRSCITDSGSVQTKKESTLPTYPERYSKMMIRYVFVYRFHHWWTSVTYW